MSSLVTRPKPIQHDPTVVRELVAGPHHGPTPPFPVYLDGWVTRGFGRGSKDLGCPTGAFERLSRRAREADPRSSLRPSASQPARFVDCAVRRDALDGRLLWLCARTRPRVGDSLVVDLGVPHFVHRERRPERARRRLSHGHEHRVEPFLQQRHPDSRELRHSPFSSCSRAGAQRPGSCPEKLARSAIMLQCVCSMRCAAGDAGRVVVGPPATDFAPARLACSRSRSALTRSRPLAPRRKCTYCIRTRPTFTASSSASSCSASSGQSTTMGPCVRRLRSSSGAMTVCEMS